MAQQQFRIFISSPCDVHVERDIARRVIADLQRQYVDLTLEPVLWEDLSLPVTASFQETIEIVLKRQSIDIAVFILWSRLGSPLAGSITKPDGSKYKRGTEREFDIMQEAFKQSGNQQPVILAYTRNDDEGFVERFKTENPDSHNTGTEKWGTPLGLGEIQLQLGNTRGLLSDPSWQRSNKLANRPTHIIWQT